MLPDKLYLLEAIKTATTTFPSDVLLATDTVAFTLSEKLVIDLTQRLFETCCSLCTTAEIVVSHNKEIPSSFF